MSKHKCPKCGHKFNSIRKIEVGFLLKGAHIFSEDGVEEWHKFPRYKVVAKHSDNSTFFCDILNEKGETIGTYMDKTDGTQWDYWRHHDL